MFFHNQFASIPDIFQRAGVLIATERHGLTLYLLIVGALAVGAIALWLLMSAPPRMRRPIVGLVTFLGGLVLALEFLIGKQYPGLTAFIPSYANAQIVIASFALLLGMVNLFRLHGQAVSKRGPGWINSLGFFVAFFAIMLAGFIKDQAHVKAASASAGSIYSILFLGFLVPLQSTMFSIIAFYIASAAYRAFRIRSAEAGLMMIAAAIIMLALVPAGVFLTSWLPATGFLSNLRLENLGYWLLVSPNMAVQRAMAFGVAVGALATGLRIWLSLERGSFFDRQL